MLLEEYGPQRRRAWLRGGPTPRRAQPAQVSLEVNTKTSFTTTTTLPPLAAREDRRFFIMFYPPGAPLRRGGVFAQGREAKGGAPLHSVDPCSFLTRVPGGAGYEMLARAKRGPRSCVCLGRRCALFEVCVEFLATGYLPMRSTRGSRPLLAFESVMK